MIDVARRDHPGLRFEVGSMTDLRLADGSLAGVLAWFSLIHIPDEDVPAVLSGFRRVLRPGGVLMLGFHAGDKARRHKTEGYGGHPMDVHVHYRTPARIAGWLTAAGFTVDIEMVHHAASGTEGGFVFAHLPPVEAAVPNGGQMTGAVGEGG